MMTHTLSRVVASGHVRRARGARVALLAVLAVGVQASGVAATARAAQPCANEALRRLEPYALTLPDCRAYEQVSPVEKNGQSAVGEPGSVQSAPNGDAVTFYTMGPFPGVPGSGNFVTYLSTRGAGGEGWATQGLVPASAPQTYPTIKGLTEDLGSTFIQASEPALAEGAEPDAYNFYLRDNATGSYSLIAPVEESYFADASAGDSYVLFEHEGTLGALSMVPAPSSGNNVYEYHEGTVTLASVVAGAAVPAVAGGGGPAAEAVDYGGEQGGSHDGFYQQRTISKEGSRVFFTDLENGQIYVRENGTTTVEVSASQRTPAEAETPAYWRAATPDGKYVFFTSEAKLTSTATAEPGKPDLYRFDTEKQSPGEPEGEKLVDLTTVAGGADAVGVLGVSEGGSYVYFVAGGTLASGATKGEPNLYVWHEGAIKGAGTITFIATLNPGNETAAQTGTVGEALNRERVGIGDTEDWMAFKYSDSVGGADLGFKSSRVTPDGGTVLFSSKTELTGYDNAGHIELYLYHYGGLVQCVSCNPNAPAAEHEATLGDIMTGAAPLPDNAFLTRNLSDSGRRVFFQSDEALLAQDTRPGVQNVYEWEEGQLHLISTGQSGVASWFGDASSEGEDVFFFTAQKLVGQEQGEETNLYDARGGGGLAAQNPPLPPPPCSGEACAGASRSAPLSGAPASVGFSGPGNLAPPEPKPATTKPKPKPLTRAQKLANALRACAKKPKRQRPACESLARRTYGAKSEAKKTGGSKGGK